MGRRAALLLCVAVLGLLGVGVGLSWRLLRAVEQAARSGTTAELRALGVAAARALERGADRGLVDDLRRDSQLEDAYLLDGDLRPMGSRAGAAPSLLRIDPDRALSALRGAPSIGPAYRLEAPLGDDAPSGAAEAGGGEVLAGYFAVASHAGPRLLVLEAGAAFVESPRRLRSAAWAASAVGAALALLFALTVILALRAAARERQLFGQAERGRAITQMAAMVAHEIRNPLGTIRAGAELLREQGRGGDITDDLLSEVDRISRLTEEFLTLSKDPPLHLSPVDLGELCDDLCAQLARRFPDEALRVERAGEGYAEIIGDEDKLRQVLLNLALNAVQAMGGRGRLELRVERGGGGAAVIVTDDGPGVDEQTSRRLFEPFATSKPGGAGLGLVLSRRIAERHGGSLELVSTAGRRGARFALRLPRRPPQAT